MLGQQALETSLPAGGRRGWLYHHGMSITGAVGCYPAKTKPLFGKWANRRAEFYGVQVKP